MDALISINQAIAGGILIAASAVALYFLRFFRQSHERLFLLLSLAFLLIALERLVLLFQPFNFVPLAEESRHWVYLFRLFAFLLIIIGVIDKNRSGRASA